MTKQPNFAHFLFFFPIIAIGIIGFSIACLINTIEFLYRSIDWTILGEAIADVVLSPFRPLPYLFHNVKFYWQQLWISEEVLDLQYFGGIE